MAQTSNPVFTEPPPATEYQSACRRLLAAMVQVVHERGYADASVSAVCARAKVSRRTFQRHFEDAEGCFLAVLDDGAARAQEIIAMAFERESSWLDGIRGALAGLLSFFDAEPELAHVLLVEATAAGPRSRARRERHIASITKMIEDHWGEPAGGQVHPLVNPGVVASLLGLLQTRLVADQQKPLADLLGPLIGIVTTPYLKRSQVQREIARADALARDLSAKRDTQARPSPAPGVEIPGFLRDPRAHRARSCLHYVIGHPGASNRQIAEALGIARTQTSALLARLRRAGLIVKSSRSAGGPNQWTATEFGSDASRALAQL